MAAVLFILIVAAFFGLMVLLVKACDLVIGPDDPTAAVDAASPAPPARSVELDEVTS